MSDQEIIDLKQPPYQRQILDSGPWGQRVKVTLPPGSRTPYHQHSLPVTGVVKRGSGGYELSEEGRCELKPGMTFKRQPGEFHAVGNDGPDDLIIIDEYPAGTLALETAPFPVSETEIMS